MPNINQDQIGDLRRVRLHFTRDFKSSTDHPTEYFMLASEVEACVEAAKELHYTREVNPFSHLPTARLWEVTVGQLGEARSYWHTTPGLGINKSERGALIASWSESTVWRHPELQKQIKDLEDQE